MFKSLLLLVIFVLTICHGYKIQPRILNGMLSDSSEYPFFIQLHGLFYENDMRRVSICGGTLLNER